MRIVSLVLLLAFLPLQSSAQAPTEGFFVSPTLYGVGVQLDEDSDVTDNGGGIALRLGYGFTKSVAAYATLGAAGVDVEGRAAENSVDEYAVGTFDLGAQFSLLPSGKVNPFLRVALNGTSVVFDVDRLDTDDDPRFGGGGLTLGAGAEFRLSRALALDAALDVTGGEFNSASLGNVQFNNLDGDEYRTGRLSVGLVWRP